MASSGSSMLAATGGSMRSATSTLPSVGTVHGACTSPIPYRERPLEYAPTVHCHCGEKAGRWISWSDTNPARRSMTCMRARAGGCKFWAWYDDEPTPFLRQVVLDLRDVVRALRKENSGLSRGIADARQELSVVESRHGEHVVALTTNLREKEDSLVGLTGKVAQLEKERRILFVLLAGFVLMLLVL